MLPPETPRAGGIQRPGPLTTVASLVAFYGGWFAAAEAARRGRPAWAAGCLAVLALAHLWPQKPRGRTVLLCLGAASAGAALDVGLLQCGVFSLPDQPDLSEVFVWLTGLWALTAAAFYGCLSWMRGNWHWAALVGAAGAALSYAAAERYGALQLGTPRYWSLGVFAVEWGCATPLLAWLAARPKRAEGPVTD